MTDHFEAEIREEQEIREAMHRKRHMVEWLEARLPVALWAVDIAWLPERVEDNQRVLEQYNVDFRPYARTGNEDEAAIRQAFAEAEMGEWERCLDGIWANGLLDRTFMFIRIFDAVPPDPRFRCCPTTARIEWIESEDQGG